MTFESLYASFVSYTVLNLAVAQGSHGGGHKLLKMQQTKVQSTFKLLITQNFGPLPALVQNDPGCDANVFTILCPRLAAGKSPFCR